MRRCALRIFVFLLLGAIVNVAVAWGCRAYLSRPREGVETLSQDEAERVYAQCASPRWHRGKISHGTRQARSGLRIRVVMCSDRIQTDNGGVVDVGWRVYCFEYGWPFPSAGLTSTINPRTGQTGLLHAALVLPPSWRSAIVTRFHILPARPVWPGFAINTVFYGAIMWMLFAAPVALRKRRRIRRGMCPKCGYDLRNRPSDSAVCPECGATR